MPFKFTRLEIPDIILVEPKIFPDDRGCFMESFKASDFQKANLPTHFVQDNFSVSKKNVIRGLHYQKNPHAQGKLVSVLKGGVWDVAVDIRRASPTFLKWVAAELNDKNQAMLYIPPGFAHGFVTLTDDVRLMYKCTAEYDPQSDAGIRWNDPVIDITWPVADPILSRKDRALPLLNAAELF
ncbi:MAG: dTDP-4-dehydrorhamnose 3,5-epimerase [Syntrophaceae bacterium]|nr:dTDP-4-dehydrorhamnose 3,5-epimerase [Syntrophaceae bacterium]